ncbi:unnamed protein product [Symbiodinium natans]|uniref:MOSC domain-containing protein n=1 Tax=Symbiodinium natans TaxID=878477 RepID=A0A812TEN4_9DINO|nr:unnamed protein product [Symbiodinium natans]
MAVPSLQARVACRLLRQPEEGDLVLGGSSDPKRPIFQRSRCKQEAVNVGLGGLENSVSFGNSVRFSQAGGQAQDAKDRAILVQTAGNVEALLSAGLSLRAPLDKESLNPGAFGENLFLDSGLSSETLCVGDELECWRNDAQQPLRLQVSSPRLPCQKVDQMLGKTFTADGVRAHCARTGRAGFFLRTLVPGDLREGDILQLAARPNPDWTLSRVSSLMYGNRKVVMEYSMRGREAAKNGHTPVISKEEFMGTEQELRELAALPELSIFEWKEYAVRALDGAPIGRYRRRQSLALPLVLTLGVAATLAVALIVQRRSTAK